MKRNFYFFLIINCSLFNPELSVAARDPTKPPEPKLSVINNRVRAPSYLTSLKKNDLKDYDIQGIIISPSRRLVLINNQLLRIGDTIGKARVMAINPNNIKLFIDGATLIIDFIDTEHWNSWL
jgi:hypothetical protein